MNFKRLSLTDIKIDIPRVPKKKTLIDAMEKAGRDSVCVSIYIYVEKVLLFLFLVYACLFILLYLMADVKNKWESSSWGRKLIVQKKRASLNDFDRFKLMLAKIKVGDPSCIFMHAIITSKIYIYI